jgi:hypothetical protein
MEVVHENRAAGGVGVGTEVSENKQKDLSLSAALPSDIREFDIGTLLGSILVKNLARPKRWLYGSKQTGFLQVCRITQWNRYKHGKNRTVVQQRTTTTTTTLSNNNALSSLTTNTFQRMPKNQISKAPTKAVSTVGPYQVQGGLKGSGSSSSQERGGKPTGTSSVSRLKSSSQQQNDG